MAVQPVVEVPVGAVCIPLREYHWYANVPAPPLGAAENEMEDGSPEPVKVWLPFASVPLLTAAKTVTGTDNVVVQPAFVELTVYVVLEAGEAVTLAEVDELNPVVGVQA